MIEIEGVVYELFTSPAMAVPPEAAVYQTYCPFAPPETETDTTPAPHEFPLTGSVGAVGTGLTVNITILEKTSSAKSPDTLQR